MLVVCSVQCIKTAWLGSCNSAFCFRYRAKNRKAVTRNSSGVNKSQEMGNKEGQTGEFLSNDKVFVQTDDLLYSTTTPTITSSQFDSSVLREGMLLRLVLIWLEIAQLCLRWGFSLSCVGYLTATPSLQVPPPVPTAAVRPPAGGLEYGTYTTAYPAAANQPASTYQPSQQQMFAPTPGTFTPDIYRYIVFLASR
jgi:hypothetical protein